MRPFRNQTRRAASPQVPRAWAATPIHAGAIPYILNRCSSGTRGRRKPTRRSTAMPTPWTARMCSTPALKHDFVGWAEPPMEEC